MNQAVDSGDVQIYHQRLFRCLRWGMGNRLLMVDAHTKEGRICAEKGRYK